MHLQYFERWVALKGGLVRVPVEKSLQLYEDYEAFLCDLSSCLCVSYNLGQLLAAYEAVLCY